MSTAKTAAPVVGFNHNVKYGPRVYHVQTEDSGLPHAHYITHLFVGGNIVSSTKSSYADKADDPELPKLVRSLMEAQHKQMLKRLVSGEFNDLAERLSATHYEPGVLATGQTGPAAVNVAKTEPGSAAALGSSIRRTEPGLPPVAPAPRAPAPAVARPPAPPPPRPAAPPPPARPAAAPPRPQQPVWQPAPPGPSAPSAPRAPGGPLPSTTRVPPPQNRPPVTPPRLAPVAPPAPRLTPPAVMKGPVPTPSPSLFDDKPVEHAVDDLPTLFAEELISEKSLDEVILAFLSADLEPPK